MCFSQPNSFSSSPPHTSLQLRIMLDRESQKDNTTVKWSTDGNSFIITDQNLFEEVGWYHIVLSMIHVTCF